MRKLILYLILLLGLGCCNSFQKDKDMKENIVNSTVDTLITNFPEENERVLKIVNNGITDKIEVFDMNRNILKRVQLYTDGLLDTMLTYYENGNINSINTFWSYKGKPIDNTWIYFTKDGDTIDDLSYYYIVDSVKKEYSKDEKANIALKINLPKYGDSIFVSNYRQVSDKEIIQLTSQQFFLEVPTNVLGMNKLEFTINDCKIENDTSLFCRPIMGVYEYLVVK